MAMKITMPISRPKLKKTRYWIDKEYITRGYMRTFPSSVTLVYDVLAMHANSKTQTAYPSMATVAKETGLSKNTIIRAIKIIERQGVIDVQRSMHRVNCYRLRDCQRWLPIEGFTGDTAPSRQFNEDTTLPQLLNQSGAVVGTPSHSPESKIEIMDEILEKLNPATRSWLLNDFEISSTIH